MEAAAAARLIARSTLPAGRSPLFCPNMVYQAEVRALARNPGSHSMFSTRDTSTSKDGDVTGQSMVAVVNLLLVDTDRGELCLDPCSSSVVHCSDLMISRLQ